MSLQTFKGRVTFVSPLERGVSENTGNAWTVQTILVVTQEQYPNSMYFTILGEDKIMNANIKEGDLVAVDYNVMGQEIQSKTNPQKKFYSNKERVYKVRHINSLDEPITDEKEKAAAQGVAAKDINNAPTVERTDFAAAPTVEKPAPPAPPKSASEEIDDLPF